MHTGSNVTSIKKIIIETYGPNPVGICSWQMADQGHCQEKTCGSSRFRGGFYWTWQYFLHIL